MTDMFPEHGIGNSLGAAHEDTWIQKAHSNYGPEDVEIFGKKRIADMRRQNELEAAIRGAGKLTLDPTIELPEDISPESL